MCRSMLYKEQVLIPSAISDKSCSKHPSDPINSTYGADASVVVQ